MQPSFFKKALFFGALCSGTALFSAAQPAQALDFSFAFRGVEGYLTGLVDNANNQIPATIFVTKSPTGEGQREYYHWATSYTTGFSVANGDIVANNTAMLFRSVPPSAWPDLAGIYGGQPGANDGYGFDLFLGDPGIGNITLPSNGNGFFLSNVSSLDDGSNGVISYKAAVPGPVPILGALAALRCSRRIRKRCRVQAPKSFAP